LQPWTSCAYQFRLTAWARTTDGFDHLYYAQFSDHYSLNVLSSSSGLCVADLDHDGDVDGVDLAIFASQFGRTNWEERFFGGTRGVLEDIKATPPLNTYEFDSRDLPGILFFRVGVEPRPPR
jgi:hypothetical protein